MARYTVLRLLIFFGFVLLFWLIGLRDNPVLLLAAAAIASAALSYVLLRGMRDEMTAKLVERHEARLAAKAQARGDEADEDAEISGQSVPGLATAGPGATAGGPSGSSTVDADLPVDRPADRPADVPADLSSDATREGRPRSER